MTRNVRLHIVYGVPCVGKSTAAIEFARHEGLHTVIHTDYVREVQRFFVSSQDVPVLARVSHTAWELFGQPTRHNVQAGFVAHAQAVAVGLVPVAKRLVNDGFDSIIEGVHFYSGIIDDLRAATGNADIDPTLLIVRTAEELRRRADKKEQRRTRGSDRKQWEESIPIMLTMQDYLISDARAHGIRVATVDDWRSLWNPRQD
jgi:2-phosphoglycerate kinase